MLLAFDPGRETGWAVLSSDGVLLSSGVGSIKSCSRKELLEELQAEFETWPITGIAMEEMIAYGSNTDSEKFKVEAIIELWAEQNNLPITSMHPMTVKKLVTGRGNCKKADMRRALKDRVEIPGRSNAHIVDAVAVGLAYLIQHEDYLL